MGILDNRVALIVGGGGGIGQVTALRLAGEGAAVAVGDLNISAATAAAERISRSARRSMGVGIDVTDRVSINAAFEAVLETFGRIDVLVNCFGVLGRALVKDMTEKEWSAMINVNLTGVFLCCQAVSAAMISQKYGRIINFSSGLAFMGKFAGAHYAAAKGGVVSFSKSLAQELAAYGVTVNTIAPGIVDTDMSRKGLPAEEIKFVEARCPMGRIAQPEDLTEAVTFLASEGSRFITGQCIHVNGGFLMP